MQDMFVMSGVGTPIRRSGGGQGIAASYDRI